MKIYQLDNNLKRTYYNFDTKNIKNIEELVKTITKNRNNLIYDRLTKDYAVYVDNIPKRICKYNHITIVIDTLNNSVRYFSSLCN